MNVATGVWAGFGSILGLAAGGYVGRQIALARPRGRGEAGAVEDAMVVGGGLGALAGAFVAGWALGEPAPALPKSTGTAGLPQLTSAPPPR